MALNVFDYDSPRAQKARLSVSLKPWISILAVVSILLLLAGIGLLVIGLSVGWVLVGLSVVPAMIRAWYKGELTHLEPLKNAETIDGLLHAGILGMLPKNPSAIDLIMATSKSNAGYFFTVRFGIGTGFLQHLLASGELPIDRLWRDMVALKTEAAVESIDAGIIILAIIRTIPSKDSLLGHLQLDEADLIDGIRWYDGLLRSIDRRRSQPAHPGGIGRDWSFGWIPYLSRFGHNISTVGSADSPTLKRRTDIIRQLTDQMSSNGRKVAALVGATGSGKTELVYQFAAGLMQGTPTAVPVNLQYHQVFLIDSSSLVSRAQQRGDLEVLLTQIFNEAYNAKNIILFFDNAQVFFQDGIGTVNISGMLLPIIQAGRLPMILSFDDQQYLRISKQVPELANNLNRITVSPTDQAETMTVVHDKLAELEYANKVTYMYQALKEAYRLGGRYINDRSMPGQAITLLEAAAKQSESGLVTAGSVMKAVEVTFGVKVAQVSDNNERDKLLNLESLIHQRMIGQNRAVSVVSDALRRARAGVRNVNRPIGTFLFLGPTGVGKTELAKSLADVYFGSEAQLIRLDMNEFVSADDVKRLIADGADQPNSLTAMVSKQPFSVILLDELEKAHSSVLTTLLQLLDEGILRDTNNRDVSFRDAIVIATSNAGADRIREYIGRGYQLDQFEETIVNELIDSHTFHAEFLNRFDEIVVFGPLSQPELLQVVDAIISSINKTLESQKITVIVTDDAKAFLVESGYDPRLGARPMRRVVQRAVENTVAKALLEQVVMPGSSLTITLEQVQAILGSTKKADRILTNQDLQ